MRTASLDFLRTLVNTPSPVGHETRGQRVWLDYAGQFADETYSDAYGNCVAVLNKGASTRIMLASHADEIAMVINYIDDNGSMLTEGRARVLDARRNRDVAWAGDQVTYFETGQGSALSADAHHGVDQLTLEARAQAVARAFDNRIGTFAVAETLRLLKESKVKLNVEVCAVSNVQEEVGLLGARQIAYSLHPDTALVVDVTHATDYPTVSKTQHGDTRIGQGPCITHGGCNHPEVVKRLEEVAAAKRIPLQHEAMSASSGTDTDVIFWTRGGIPSGLISLPNRYMHSPVEVVSLKDLEMIPQLMAGFVHSLKKGELFKVKI